MASARKASQARGQRIRLLTEVRRFDQRVTYTAFGIRAELASGRAQESAERLWIDLG